MQEDTFLQEYQQEWQQDNEAMSRLVDIPLETLHENIARYERRKRSRRIVWTTLSAAACLAFAVTTGIHYLTPSTTTDSPVLVAENRVERHTPRLTAYPSPEGTAGAVINKQTDKQAKHHLIKTNNTQLQDNITQQATVEEFGTINVTPNAEDEFQFSILNPQIQETANVIETSRLVAMGETRTPAVEVETDGLVKIVSPSRNTFHEAVVEPLLALVTFDM